MTKRREVGILGLVFAILLLLLCQGCVTTTTIDEGDGVILQEQPSLEDQVKVDRG